MKIILFISLGLFAFQQPLMAQKLVKIVYMKDGVVTNNASDANMLIAFRSVNGLYQRNDYSSNGPLRTVKTYKDPEQTILEGHYLEYDHKGNLQLAGYYVNNKKTGTWFYFKDSGNIVKTEQFPGPGVFDDAGNDHNNITLPVFKSGKNEWRNYLHSNVNRKYIRDEQKPEEVKISFSITASGVVKNPVLTKSAYFASDNEIIRTIISSPRWKPALHDGKKVSYRYLQSLSLYDLFHKK